MKQILVILILMVGTITRGNTNAQNLPTDKPTNGYTINIYPDAENNVSLVKFKVPEEVFVRIIVIDELQNVIETLVEGDVDAGVHCIYYKPAKSRGKRKLECRIEIYKTENSDLIYAKNIDVK
ncbi:MAG: hypothetical protein ABIY50_06720 [Ignavibacteria bacterium]